MLRADTWRLRGRTSFVSSGVDTGADGDDEALVLTDNDVERRFLLMRRDSLGD